MREGRALNAPPGPRRALCVTAIFAGPHSTGGRAGPWAFVSLVPPGCDKRTSQLLGHPPSHHPAWQSVMATLLAPLDPEERRIRSMQGATIPFGPAPGRRQCQTAPLRKGAMILCKFIVCFVVICGSASPLSHTWQITSVVCGNRGLATAVVSQGALQPAQYLVSRVADVLLGRGSAPAFHMVGQVGRDLLGSIHILIRGVHVCRVRGPGLLAPGAAFWREKASVKRSQRLIRTPGHQSHP